jgi:hypothetical protein
MSVLTCRDIPGGALDGVLGRYRLSLTEVADGQAIPGSYWGDSEAGLVGDCLFVRADTPVHSALHEAGHLVCMTPDRRSALDRDAGGDYDEENGVCYLQILLADHVRGMGRARMMKDMDEWGYTFRSGSAAGWFHGDAEDAREWLQRRGLIDEYDQPSWKLRGDSVDTVALRAIAGVGA